MDAVILLNKPAGMTSFQAVARVRKILHEKKIGHTGTLDPDATGLLIILTGKYTKYIPYCVCNHKHYEAQFQLGMITDTQDISGTVLETKTPQRYSDEQLQEYAKPFHGEITQIPPMYSALKKDGKKLYELARKGIEVEREPRKAMIEDLEVHYLHDNIYSLSATVSSGTYIRTLIQDYAASFGELACMTSLNRTAIEHVDLSMATDFEGLEKGEGMVSPFTILNPAWPLVETDRVDDVKNGKRIFMRRKEDRMILVYDGEVLAAYEREEGNRYRCVRGLF